MPERFAPGGAAALAAALVAVAGCGGGDDGDAGPALAAEPRVAHGPVEVFHEVGAGESFGAIAEAEGIPYAEMLQLVEAAAELHDLTRIRAGRTIQLRFDPDSDALLDLAYPLSDDSWVVLHRGEDGAFAATTAEVPYEVGARALTATVESMFWTTCADMGLADADIIGLAGIFEYDIDFATEVRQGDRLAVWVETLSLDGGFAKYGSVLAARYINDGEAHEALRFTPTDGKTGYYTRGGMSTRKRFLRSPLEFSRVSSGFSRKRYHPVLHKNRPHYGTDFSAPHGTPVRALGDGRVTFAGWKGGYGNLVIIQHDRTYSTRYGHFSRFGKGIESGVDVEQGQIIGYVGATGLATGPHLHFEFRVDGNPVDFTKQEFPNTEPVEPADMPRFEQERDALLAHIDEVLPSPEPADGAE